MNEYGRIDREIIKSETEVKELKKRLTLCLFLFLCLCLLLPSCTLHRVISDIPYTELGIPSTVQYPTGIRARSPWDMIVWDGYLYVGGGDFDANTGPLGIYRMDLTTGNWESSDLLPEEEFNRFCVLDGQLIVPGIDPKEDWNLGNYYVLNDGVWEQSRVLPNGVHAFDMVSYDGMIFAGLGVESQYSPIVMSDDGGETFSPVTIEKDGETLDTTGLDIVRVYDLFVFGDRLYASLLYGNGSPYAYELYRYENGRFVFDNDWNGKVKRKSISYRLICEKVEYNDRLYIATGNLYVTTDLDEMTVVSFPYTETVFDLAVDGGKLYALCARRQNDGTIRVSVWRKNGNDPTVFTQLFNFTYPVAPLSLAVKDDAFYIGMASTGSENNLNGMILKILYQ